MTLKDYLKLWNKIFQDETLVFSDENGENKVEISKKDGNTKIKYNGNLKIFHSVYMNAEVKYFDKYILVIFDNIPVFIICNNNIMKITRLWFDRFIISDSNKMFDIKTNEFLDYVIIYGYDDETYVIKHEKYIIYKYNNTVKKIELDLDTTYPILPSKNYIYVYYPERVLKINKNTEKISEFKLDDRIFNIEVLDDELCLIKTYETYKLQIINKNKIILVPIQLSRNNIFNYQKDTNTLTIIEKNNKIIKFKVLKTKLKKLGEYYVSSKINVHYNYYPTIYYNINEIYHEINGKVKTIYTLNNMIISSSYMFMNSKNEYIYLFNFSSKNKKLIIIVDKNNKIIKQEFIKNVKLFEEKFSKYTLLCKRNKKPCLFIDLFNSETKEFYADVLKNGCEYSIIDTDKKKVIKENLKLQRIRSLYC